MGPYTLSGQNISDTYYRLAQFADTTSELLDGYGDSRSLFISNALSANTIYSGSTNLYDIFLTADGNDITRVQSGLNIYTGGTVSFPTINISAATLNYLSATTISGGTIYSGGTNLYDIFLTSAAANDITRVQPGSNINTGGTENNPTINLIASPSVNNIISSGSSQLGTTTASSFSGGTVSGGTLFSGSTNLYNIFAQIGTDIDSQTSISKGTNTYTGGTFFNPTVNVSALTINTLVASGSSQLGITTASSISGATVSGDTIYSGSTDLYHIFLKQNGYLLQKNGIVSGSSFTGTTLKYTINFETSFLNNEYSISISSEASRFFTLESKSANGFTINSNSNSRFNSENVFWSANEVGEGFR